MSRDVNNDVLLDSNKQEIDIKIFFNIFWRRKIIIFVLIIISTFTSLINALKANRIYQGEFQVVINDNVKGNNFENLISSFEDLKSLTTGFNKLGYELKTQVKVMQSPSVLMDIFRFVEDKKKEKTDKKNFTLRFNKWKKENLKIVLEEGTTILNISYKDGNKEIILPVLKKLSKRYKEFNSAKEKQRNIRILNFLKNQITLYNKISLDSISKLQDFSSEHDLSPIIPTNNAEQNEFISTIESRRIALSNELRTVNGKISQLVNKKNDSQKLDSEFYLADQDFVRLNQNFIKLSAVQNNLINLKIIYKDIDPLIKKEERIRSLLIENISNDYLNYLKNKKDNLIVEISTLERPKEVLIEYKKLLEEAKRNSSLLVNLENQYLSASLLGAKGYEPYELVTEPTLLPYPVGPQRKKMVFQGMIYGLLAGAGLSILIDKKIGIVYSIDEIRLLTGIPFKGQLNFEEFDNWEGYLKLAFKSLEFPEIKSIGLYYPVQVDPEVVEKIEKEFQNNFPKLKINSTFDQYKALQNSCIFLIIPLGLSKVEKIKSILRKIKIYDIKTQGFLVIK